MGACLEVQSSVTVSGLVHLANVGDVAFSSSMWGGTKGQARQMEGFQLQLNGATDVNIEYMAHQAEVGDLHWMAAGSFCGSRGQSRRIEGIAVRLTGPGASRYTVRYQVHMSGRGDSEVCTNGQYCGSKGESRAIEAIRVWVEGGAGSPPLLPPIPSINTLVHLAEVGDVRSSGSTFAGTKGESRRMEGFELTTSDPSVGLEYMCHAANVGDMGWVSQGQFQGSRGQSRQIEGIAIRLTGHHAGSLNVNYVVHMAGKGDSPVAQNGTYCGTKGEGRAIEGIHVWFTRR